ncbi:MAG: hypothetical protein GXP61_02055 [Epsilonproteobacteria bacterium]|nr:hypothetical protein [Campylobacterota bacterium]
MGELFRTALIFHTAFVGIVLILATINYFAIGYSLGFDKLRKRVRTTLPIYYMFLAMVIFTGLVLFSVAKFEMYQSVIYMILTWFVILLTTIRRYKKFKSLKREDKRRIIRFVKFSKRKYLIDIIFILVTMALVYGLKG